MTKRLFDIALALVLILPTVLISVLAMIAVRLESRGAPLFVQQRVGKNRRTFSLFKLRTMFIDTPHASSHDVPASQITRVGHVLRRSKVDELPQIWNVLIGDMSFVGPRPCLLSQSELIIEREARGAFAVRPGITGPAQIAGVDMSTPALLAEIDARYIAERSLLGDVRLILQTAGGGGRGDAVRTEE